MKPIIPLLALLVCLSHTGILVQADEDTSVGAAKRELLQGCGNDCSCPNEQSCTNGAAKEKCCWDGSTCRRAGQCGGCFPGDAMSILLGGAHVRMDELKTGDKVLTVDAKGRPAYDEVVFFGHQTADYTGTMVQLTVGASCTTNATHTLRLTDRHFVPVKTTPVGGYFHKYAMDVTVGDFVKVVVGSVSVTEARVIGKELVTAKGLYNPYTTGGSIVVDGVVASAHSNFVLDDITPSSLTHMLPYVYQALMVTPLTILYRVLGPQNMHTFMMPLVNWVLSLDWRILQGALATAVLGGVHMLHTATRSMRKRAVSA